MSSSKSQGSLTRKMLMQMGIRITIVIILATGIGYWHLVSVLKSQTLKELERYVIERGQRESNIFNLAQDNHLVLKEEFSRRLQELGDHDPLKRFEQFFVKWSDGTTRNRPKDQSSHDFDTILYPGIFIGKQTDINADIRRRVMIFYDLLMSYGPAWRNRFVDTYFLAPENMVVNYWPGEPWGLTAPADLNIQTEEYFYVSDKKHNPERRQAWTGLYFDHVVELWMVSVETPIDDDKGKHIATIGNDIILNELMDRTIHNTFEGAYNLILRHDGRLIAHPNKMIEIQEKEGYFDIFKSGDQHLIRILELVKKAGLNQTIIENIVDNEYLAITQLEGPHWYFVTVYPKSLLSTLAFKTSRFIMILAIISLLIAILILFFVWRNQVAKPLHEFILATRQLATGNFCIETITDKEGRSIMQTLPIERSDELGQLAQSFQIMADQLKASFDTLELQNIEFKAILEDIVQVSQGLATGNLGVTPQAEYTGNLIEIKSALEEALANLRVVTKDIVRVSQGLATGELQITPTAEYQGDFEQIKNALETATTKLAKATKKNATQDWLKTGQTQLNDLISGEHEIMTLAKNIITFLATYNTKALVGLFYLLEKPSQNAYLKLIANYGYGNVNRPEEFSMGQGLVGQAALEQRTISFNPKPEECIPIIRSVLANALPKHILLIPVLYENTVKGVIEIGFSETPSPLHQEFLEQVMPNIGIAVNTAESRTRMQELLHRSQKQTDALQEQSETLHRKQSELQETNEELQSQSEELQVQAEELQTKEEELRQSNEELEERTRELERQKADIQQKNIKLKQTQVDMEEAKVAVEAKAKELELTNKYKSEFLANMSHELRTPLNSLLILSQLLADNKDGHLSDKQVEYAQTMNSAGSELLTLINEILDLSKVEAGKMEAHFEEVSATDLIKTIEQKFRHIAEDKGVDFSIKIVDDVTYLHTDEQRLKQILNNLLSNALKFTSQGKIQLTVQHSDNSSVLQQQDNENLFADTKIIAISVADTGIGIPTDKQKVIFEAFQQVDGSTSRNYGGTGLGLSISRQFARLIGGEIELHSVEGEGSTFTLYLPETISSSIKVSIPQTTIKSSDNLTETSILHQEEIDSLDNSIAETQMQQKTDIKPLNNDISALIPQKVESNNVLETLLPASDDIVLDNIPIYEASEKSILIIEDDFQFSKILMELAEEKGFKCFVAEDGETGLQMAEEKQPTAIVLDIGLPKIDGLTLMDQFKDNLHTQDIPVHFISGSDLSSEAKKKGAIGYLHKPANTEQLGEAFKKIEQFIKPLKTLLVITDNQPHQQNILTLLGGVHATIAITKNAAIQHLKTTEFDCIILDMDIEQGSGIKLVEQMKKEKEQCQTPVIIYTERDLTSSEEALLLQCAENLTIKSVNSSERLLDEATLLLHKIDANLPWEQRSMLRMVHDKETILAHKKVLIVDDDIRNLFVLVTLLEDKEMDVISASNGQEALNLLERNEDIAIILMDIMMPEMDGYEAMKRVRKNKNFRKLPIIALTAKAMKGDKGKCIDAGANDYLPKPIDTDKLLSLMRVWLYR
ncbi:response regulator [Candidatus Parabeggiatoa sp. HSG14]|uniref:response regulator n=1 Tax=Candidatus Parabeggiatoa sp. HSG14 TaxID=3055593 RepID=UPI0025A69B1E|nr:response regulator [Thiotrichales bacterium HSG14]